MAESTKILVGKIVGAQGLRGDVRVHAYTQSPEDLRELGIRNEELGICGKFVRALPNSSVIIAKIDGADDRDAAAALRGIELFVDRDALPSLPDGEFYHADLIGMAVQKGDAAHLVAAVHDFGAGIILELDNGEMISFNDAKVDAEKKTISFE